MELKFRQLRADEIDCRVAQIKENGLTLLLYKDARCDMNILDETVGAMNWQRAHGRDNANCVVSIYDPDKQMWVSKEDTGTESNTEAEKGLASDSFKRACFNWGIGRELYTAPFIWVKSDDCEIKKSQSGKLGCYDKFEVLSISYKDGKISDLEIYNTTKNCVAYSMRKPKAESKPTPKAEQSQSDPSFKCENCGKVLTPYIGTNGKTVSLRAHSEGSKKKFGRVLCLDCISKLNEG